jgi:hypothetical protein
MHQQILSLFPAHVHPLTLVSDPDGLLGGESTRVDLARRGFTLIQESDPVLLRRRVAETAAPSVEHPLLVITAGPLESLPYDLWQPGYHLQLSLHQYFNNLAYPVLQSLSPGQLEVLTKIPQPNAPLGRQKTMEFLLRGIFRADSTELNQPHQLIGWLTRYHQNASPMPALLREYLVERLRRLPAFQNWSLAEWISDPQAFSSFLQGQWTLYVQTNTGKEIGEGKGEYHLGFQEDQRLQEMVPDLVRKRFIQPVEAPAANHLPDWAVTGLAQRDTRSDQIQNMLDDFNQQIPSLIDANWETWKRAAFQWAELNVLLFNPGQPSSSLWNKAFRITSQAMDGAFLKWLQSHYALLGAQRLPRPSHVHHIPHFMAYQRGLTNTPSPKVALLVLDGISLADWSIIQSQWSQRNTQWQVHTDLLLAQIPTITALSRYALISGLRPSDFANRLETLPSEEKKWQMFWTNQELPANAIGFERLSLDRLETPAEIESSRLLTLGLIDDTLDRLTHNATLGAADQQSSLRLWLDPTHTPNSAPLEALISRLVDRQFIVFIASDHGHVEAIGFGQPSEGLVAQTRGKRARIYQDRNAAQRVQTAFAETVLWENDGLNPPDLFALMPSRRTAFAPNGEVVVTHGGVTIDEVIVPFIRIDKKF